VAAHDPTVGVADAECRRVLGQEAERFDGDMIVLQLQRLQPAFLLRARHRTLTGTIPGTVVTVPGEPGGGTLGVGLADVRRERDHVAAFVRGPAVEEAFRGRDDDRPLASRTAGRAGASIGLTGAPQREAE